MEGPPRQEGVGQGSDSGDTQQESSWQQERRKYNPFGFLGKHNTSERKIYFTRPEDFQVPEEEQDESDRDDEEVSDAEDLGQERETAIKLRSSCCSCGVRAAHLGGTEN